MKIRIPMMIEINFDIDTDDQNEVDINQLRNKTINAIFETVSTDSMVDYITDETGWCVTGFSVTSEE